MTISSTDREAGPFIGNGSTTALPFDFKVFSASDLLVVRLATSTGVETNLVLNTDYTVTLNADQNANPGGTVTLATALATGFQVTITSNLDYLQPVDLTNQGGFYPRVINDGLDRLVVFIQQILSKVNRSVRLPLSVTGVDAELPIPEASTVLGWDQAGTGLQNYAFTAGLGVTDVTDAAAIDYPPPFLNASTRKLDQKLADFITSRDFGVPAGLTDDGQNHTRLYNAAVECLKKGQTFTPQGDILISAPVNWDTRLSSYDNIDPLIPTGIAKRLKLDLSQCRIYAKGSAFADTRYAELNGNGSTTVFTIPFAFADNARVMAYVGGTQVIPASVTGAGGAAGTGSITFSSAPASGTKNIKLFYRDQNITDIVTIATQSEGVLFNPRVIIVNDTGNLNWMQFFNVCGLRVVSSDRLAHSNPVIAGLINPVGVSPVGGVDFGPGISYWLDDCMTPSVSNASFLYSTRYGIVSDTGVASVDPLVSKASGTTSAARVITSGCIGPIYTAGGRPGGLSRNDYTGIYPGQSFLIIAPTSENGNNPGCMAFLESDTNIILSPWPEGIYDMIYPGGGFGNIAIGGCHVRSAPTNYAIEGRGSYSVPGSISPRTPPSSALNSMTIIDSSSTSPGIQLGNSLSVQGRIIATGEFGATASWTPTTNSDPTGAISGVSGTYKKLGNTVILTYKFTVTTNFTNSSIGGLPFTPAGSGVVSAGAVVCGTGTAGTLTTQLNGGSNVLFFRRNSDVNTAHSPSTTGGTYVGSIMYFT